MSNPDRNDALAQAIEDGTLGAGSIAGDEYVRNMECARRLRDGSVKWVEVCYCATPLEEERPYWEEYFDLVKVQDAHARSRCKDLNGEEAWACSDCDCTDKLEARLATWGPCSSTRSELPVLTQSRRGRRAILSEKNSASLGLYVEYLKNCRDRFQREL